MHLRKKSIRFFLTFILTFAALIVAWSVVGSAYGSLFRGAGGAMAIATGPWSVKYSRQLDGDSHHDTQVLLRNRRDSLKRDVNLSSRRMAYMPTIFLVALTLATPVPWARKRLALLWGLIGVHVYIAARLAIVPATYIAARGDDSETLLRKLEWILSGSSAGWAIVPLIIWVVITLKYALPNANPGSPQAPADNNPG